MIGLVGMATSAPAIPPTVGGASPLARIQRRDPVVAATSISLEAARNETENVQLIVRAPSDRALVGVNVSVSDLTGPGLIPRSAVTLYRAHYVRVTVSSQGNGTRSPHPPGEWPDALVPFAIPGGTYPSAPFGVPAGENQPVWIEVRVPKGAAAGSYAGTVTITEQGASVATVPLAVTVFGFTLPDQPGLGSTMNQYDTWFTIAPAYSPGAVEATLRANLYAALDAHRLGAGKAAQYGHWTGSTKDKAFVDSWMPTHSFVLAPNSSTDAELRDLMAYLDARGWKNLIAHYIADEPKTQSQFDAIKAEAPRWRSLGIPTMTTITSQTAWTALDGAIDYWVCLFSDCTPSQVQAKLAQGGRVWAYTEGGVRPAGYPSWLLDFDLVNFRIPGWLTYRTGMTGILYWAVANWKGGDPWTNAGSGSWDGNGNGYLFYPGSAVGAPSAAIPSARLKAIRDGVDDYDYLRLLAAKGDAALAAQLGASLASGWSSWSHDPAALAAARRQAADRLRALCNSDCDAGLGSPGKPYLMGL